MKTIVTGIPCFPNGEPNGQPRSELPYWLVEIWRNNGRPDYQDATNPWRDVREDSVASKPPISVRYLRPLVNSILKDYGGYSWTLQGFGMLHLYLSPDVRIHVWDSRFAIPNVSTIHDHPWHLESVVVSGKITNTRYVVHRCAHNMVARLRIRTPFIKSEIVCGPGGNNMPMEVKARGERVWLDPREPEVYVCGESYSQKADEVHHTSYDDGTVTIVSREFLPDTEHAHVFFRADDEWVSAEPRAATTDEVREIVGRALDRWDAQL